MRIIERYLLRELLFPIFFCLYVLVFLFLISDLFDNLYEIINNKTPLIMIIQYYLNLIPFAAVQTISWATFLGTVYLFSSFARHGELIAMKACGLRITNIIMPFLYLGLIIGVVTFLINDRVVPATFAQSEKIKRDYIDQVCTARTHNILSNVTLLSNNRQYFIKAFNVDLCELNDIRIHILDNKNKYVKYKVMARRGTWNNGTWHLYDITIHHLDSRGRLIGAPEIMKERDFKEFTETPDDFIQSASPMALMTSKQLKRHISRLKENDLNANIELTDLNNKRAVPWQSIVILLVTAPFLGRTGTRRSNITRNIFIALVLVFAYHICFAVCLALGNKGILPPLVSAWFANIAFTTAGILLMETANY